VDNRSSPLLVTLGLGVSLPRSKIEKSIIRSTLVSPVRQTCTTVVYRVCCEQQAAAWSVTASVVFSGDRRLAIGMWGYTPVVLVPFWVTSVNCKGRIGSYDHHHQQQRHHHHHHHHNYYTVSQETVQNCFCQNFVKFPPILINFWQKDGKEAKII